MSHTVKDAPLRIRCEVLRTLATHGPMTSAQIAEQSDGLTPKQVQKAVYRLLDQDRIFKASQEIRKGKEGRPMFVYDVRDDWEPRAGRTGGKVGRQSYRQSLREPSHGFLVVKFRDRKIRLLNRIAERLGGADRDLLLGIIADYKISEPEAA